MSRTVLSNFHNVFLLIFLCSLLHTFLLSKAREPDDINCLKSIKLSLKDPFGSLDSWVFNNDTEGFICGFTGIDCWHPDENRVLNLRLSGMRLKGRFPRGTKICSSLTGLDLSNNELDGPTPFDIIPPFVTALNLSYNNFSGEIPSSIASQYLNVLLLDNNQFTGEIPIEIGHSPRLKTFNVANNLLSGPVPTFVNDAYITNESFANNPGLCGQPLEPCKQHRWKLDSFKTGFVIGYVVSLLLVTVALIPYALPPWLKLKTRNQMLKKTRKINPVTVDNPQEGGKEILKLEKAVARLPYTDLSQATNNFSEKNIMGWGKMGITFKATLQTGGFLAVKKLHYQLLDEQFIAELKMLGIMKHNNLLPLVGFCIRSKERLLIYKYMANGSLYDWLHSVSVDQARVMDWPVRIKIATGLASVLAWLHQGCNIRVIHLNLSSKCILLDHDFEPKLSNFGEAMFMISSNNSSVNDNEFWETAFFKEDVYGFGLVLLELITGKDPFNSCDGSPNEWVSRLLESNSSTFHDLIHESLIKQGFDTEIQQFLQIAFACVQPNPERRPTMLQVHEQITAKRHDLTHPHDSQQRTKTETSTVSDKGKSLEIEVL